MNNLTKEEILDIYSFLYHLSLNFNKDEHEKVKLNSCLDKLKSIVLQPETQEEEYEEDNNSATFIEYLPCKIRSDVLYSDGNSSYKDIKLTITQNNEHECFELYLHDDLNEEPFHTLIDELALELETKKLICVSKEGDEFEILLEDQYIESLSYILSTNCDSQDERQ